MSLRTANTLLLLLLMAGATGVASARTSDRNQPMDAASNVNSCSLGDGKSCELTGSVKITQGTLDIHADKAVIYRGASGDISRAVFTGGPVVLKQVLDDGTPMTAHAGNIDYNLDTEVVIFTGDVKIQQPSGSLSGQRVVYNLKTSSIEGRGDSNGQVHMRILPSGGKAKAQPSTPKPPAADTSDSAQPAADAPTEPAAADKDTN